MNTQRLSTLLLLCTLCLGTVEAKIVLPDIVGFEVAGADGKFFPAKARLNESHKSIMVSAEQVAAPTAVRYCFKAFQPGNLKSVRGLPVVPFRSDR